MPIQDCLTFSLLPLHIVAIFTDVSKQLFNETSAKIQKKKKLVNIAKIFNKSSALHQSNFDFEQMHWKYPEAEEKLQYWGHTLSSGQARSGDAAFYVKKKRNHWKQFVCVDINQNHLFETKFVRVYLTSCDS